jgi:hypothetical protein
MALVSDLSGTFWPAIPSPSFSIRMCERAATDGGQPELAGPGKLHGMLAGTVP